MSTRQDEDGVRRATAPEIRALVRRWSRRQNLAVGMALVGIALPVVTLGVVALVPRLNGDESIGPFIWSILGVAVVLLVGAAFLESHAQDRLREAKFAGGYRSAGMVDRVVEEPSSEVGGLSTHMLLITAELPGQGTIRRRLYSSEYPAGPDARVGQTMIFRHVTLDPDDLQDVLFVRFTGTAQKERG